MWLRTRACPRKTASWLRGSKTTACAPTACLG